MKKDCINIFIFASLAYHQSFAVYRMNEMVIVIDATLVTF